MQLKSNHSLFSKYETMKSTFILHLFEVEVRKFYLGNEIIFEVEIFNTVYMFLEWLFLSSFQM